MRGRTHVLAVTVLGCLSLGASADGAAASKQRALTETWSCENNRVVNINYHPRRERVPAWITYLGNRVEVQRKRAPEGNTFASRDGKVGWTEDDGVGRLSYEGLLEAPVPCRRGDNTKK